MVVTDNRVFIRSREVALKERIGRGKFSFVYRALWNSREVAVKRMRFTEVEGRLNELADGMKELMYVLLWSAAYSNSLLGA